MLTSLLVALRKPWDNRDLIAAYDKPLAEARAEIDRLKLELGVAGLRGMLNQLQPSRAGGEAAVRRQLDEVTAERDQLRRSELRGLPNRLQAPCPDCGKVRYFSRRAAKETGRFLYPGAHMSAYRCGEFWHIGNAPVWLVAGGGRAGRLAGDAARKAASP